MLAACNIWVSLDAARETKLKDYQRAICVAGAAAPDELGTCGLRVDFSMQEITPLRGLHYRDILRPQLVGLLQP